MSLDPADMSGADGKPTDAEFPTLEEKVRFLGDPSSYTHGQGRVTIKETHMSWVFLTDDRVYKLKKPVRYPYLDFRSLAARERYCREEVRLNCRLAPGIYLGVTPLTRSQLNILTLNGEGEVVDWLVEMKRLPAECMLDVRLKERSVGESDVTRLAEVLANFYRSAEHPKVEPEKPYLHFLDELTENRAVLLHSGLLPEPSKVSRLLDQIEAVLEGQREPLRARVRGGHIVEGHGDLRPEHVCLTDPVVIFDCLEFSWNLRLLDPFDELSFLGMECARLGAAWFGPALNKRVADLLGDHAPGDLVALYTVLHAILRARLSLAHLLDPVPRDPQKWVPLSQQYLNLAQEALAAMP